MGYHISLLINDSTAVFYVYILLDLTVFKGDWQYLKVKRQKQPPEVLREDVLKIYSNFTGEHPCGSVISIKLQATLLKSYIGMGVLL